MDTTIEKITNLASLRNRILETQKRLITPINEFEDVVNMEMAKTVTKNHKKIYCRN